MHARRAVKPASRPASARERIDRTAYELFSRHGIRAVGVDTISARSGVAKMTLYKHYPSKKDLALAFLRRREELWTRSWLQQEVERRAHTPAELCIGEFIESYSDLCKMQTCNFFIKMFRQYKNFVFVFAVIVP